MVSIGFRASPSKVFYALVRGKPAEGFVLLAAGCVHIPPALEMPRQLQFVRTTLLDIMEEYGALRAGIRLSEGTALQRNPFRLNLEGVIQELLASSDVERFVAGPIATIAGLLGERDRTVIKKYVSGEAIPAFDIAWASLSAEHREATLMAIAAAHTTSQAAPRAAMPLEGAAQLRVSPIPIGGLGDIVADRQ